MTRAGVQREQYTLLGLIALAVVSQTKYFSFFEAIRSYYNGGGSSSRIKKRRKTSIVVPPRDGPNRTLVVVVGNLRGGEEAWTSLCENVLDPSYADLALMIGYMPESERKSSLYRRAKYTWFFQEYDDWADAIDLLNFTNWRRSHLRKMPKENGLLGGIKGYPGSGAIVQMARWFLMNHIKEMNLTAKYDQFAVVRSDFYYYCMHNVSSLDTSKYTWLPEGEGYGGYPDRQFIAGSQNILKALNILPTFLNTTMKNKFKKDFVDLNPEELMKNSWDKQGLEVEFFPPPMFSCAVSEDTTRWKLPEKAVPGIPGLYTKYEFDYHQALRTCQSGSGDTSSASGCSEKWCSVEAECPDDCVKNAHCEIACGDEATSNEKKECVERCLDIDDKPPAKLLRHRWYTFNETGRQKPQPLEEQHTN